MASIKVTDESFEREVIEKSKTVPVVVDFWASRCGLCKVLEPVFEKIAEEYDGKVVLAKLSVEENTEKPQEFDITSIPAVKLFKDGKVVDEFIGLMPEQNIREWIQKNL